MRANSTGKSRNIEISYQKGDATRPQFPGNKIIAHICNDIGAWGKGFVLAISRRWKEPEKEFRKKRNPSLGTVQFVRVEEETWVANMFAQKGIRGRGKSPPIRYDALEEALQKVTYKAHMLAATVHMPRIGCGLAGGKWDMVEQIIRNTLLEANIYVVVYDLK